MSKDHNNVRSADAQTTTETIAPSPVELVDSSAAGAVEISAADAQSAPPPTPEPVPTPEQIKELQAKAAQAEAHWNRYVRATADLENYKKRAARERMEASKYATASLLEKLIPVMDNFDMALAATSPGQTPTLESYQAGVHLIYGQLRNVLAEAGLEEIDATAQSFDPNCHEAVAHQESPSVPEGHVLQQLRKGYRLRDRLLRPASVVVAKSPAA